MYMTVGNLMRAAGPRFGGKQSKNERMVGSVLMSLFKQDDDDDDDI